MKTGKVCKKCKEFKDYSLYHRSTKYKNGYYGSCIACTRLVSETEENKELRFIRQLKSYGLTLDKYSEMLEKQNGVCAICFGPEPVFSRLCIDHCHDKGHVRGLLCSSCNKAIGLLKDDTAKLLSAVRYLNGTS